ncbi:transcription initiation factor TFIID subunit 14b [Typha latifolia]|uniref:transcription initiation factor TFIID subunit 14b n=1 Tax=Typha latifolia TaxID=4733 RepID=UPI003C306643
MPQTAPGAAAAAAASSSKKQGGEQPDSSPAQKAQRSKTGRLLEDADKKTRKLKDVEISIPIVYGTISFWLGKKASEYNSHKWTVYVRGATNEDLSVIVKRAVFQLHPSFNNPTRVVESAPFELSESGWGEFEIAITLFFHSDVCDKQLDLYHQLRLYPDDDSGPQSTKKPVVVETYDEIVFSEPTEAFFLRVQNHPAAIVPRLPAGLSFLPPGPIEHVNENKRGDTKDHPLSQWFMNFSEADELLKLAAARQQVQAHIVKLRRQLSMIDGMPQQSKAVSGQ